MCDSDQRKDGSEIDCGELGGHGKAESDCGKHQILALCAVKIFPVMVQGYRREERKTDIGGHKRCVSKDIGAEAIEGKSGNPCDRAVKRAPKQEDVDAQQYS